MRGCCCFLGICAICPGYKLSDQEPWISPMHQNSKDREELGRGLTVACQPELHCCEGWLCLEGINYTLQELCLVIR